MGSEVLEDVEVSRPTSTYTDVYGRRLGSLEVRECTVEIMAELKPKTVPEIRTGYEGRTPIPTDLRGHDQITLVGAIFENSRQGLRRKPVDGNKRVPDHPNCLRNLGEFTFDVIDL